MLIMQNEKQLYAIVTRNTSGPDVVCAREYVSLNEYINIHMTN